MRKEAAAGRNAVQVLLCKEGAAESSNRHGCSQGRLTVCLVGNRFVACLHPVCQISPY
ncbi:hypothetical protein KM92DES2_10360 [uncultured Desulfovibrio sp.]|uniref:Uncharacterized protein n=1 Tax=uncultured Desulfovibrio sp. TaxID=167968 RepID=A0A212J132_9BACT|nr:hypothetical protein KM92DES2_10360 [uncultured Desulfovibrio sp.]